MFRSEWIGNRIGAELLVQTQFTQPALFTIEYALAKLWMSWGVKPAAMIGHSVGEYVAGCLAGVFTLDDALSLVARGAAPWCRRNRAEPCLRFVYRRRKFCRC